MRRRQAIALLGVVITIVTCITLYLSIEVNQLTNGKETFQQKSDENEIAHIEKRLARLEDDLKYNHKTIDEIMATVKDLLKFDPVSNRWKKNSETSALNGQSTSINKSTAMAECSLVESPPAPVDVQMLAVYRELPFDNPDGGVWKQGWPIKYKTSQWTPENKLKVIVVPHSHNDPGWRKTYEKYYLDDTRHILDNMVAKLSEDVRRKFIWAEISYLSRWWAEADTATRDSARKLIRNGQLEIVTGGWVMNDEATAHFYAMLLQMIEGHEWIMNHIGVYPRHGWAIDPFGMSSTMAYLLKRMGFESMLIQRVHYSVKKYFAHNKLLEFIWKQTWDSATSTDMFCHMMPFFSYDIPHTCGPDPKICCQFDFKRLPGEQITCPWKVPPQAITKANVNDRAMLLLDQYRKKSQLFRTNVVLIPLGDDFRYDTSSEWDQQFNNYQMLFDYMNKQVHWNVEAKFGTLRDYYNLLTQESVVTKNANRMERAFPSVSGDFFTYADRNDHYWSGYYTSRPFYKNMDRVLEANLRASDLLLSLALAEKKFKSDPDVIDKILPDLVEARRSLALFQHHDGITGTARDHVVIDYATRMLNAIVKTQAIIAVCTERLLVSNSAQLIGKLHLVMDEERKKYSTMPKKRIMDLSENEPQLIVFHNSLSSSRTELISIHVSTPYVCVRFFDSSVIPNQVNPVWVDGEISSHEFMISFVAVIPAAGFSSYTIHGADKSQIERCKISFASVGVFNADNVHNEENGIFGNLEVKNPSEVQLKNKNILAAFDSNGLLKALQLSDKTTLKTELEFLKYGVTSGKDKSGVYLFLPDGDAEEVIMDNRVVRVTIGTLLSEMEVLFSGISHKVQIKNSPGVDGLGVDILNVVDISSETNRELVMRLKTSIDNRQLDFFTDLNGFQMTRRQTLSKLPLQANVYPMTTAAFLEDENTRISILSGQSLGVAALKTGWLEVIQDRRLIQDDDRGLGQGVTDNVPTPNRFRLLFEKRSIEPRSTSNPNGYLSLLGHWSQLTLVHPVFVMHSLANKTEIRAPKPRSMFGSELPCDFHLPVMRISVDEGSAVLRMKNKTAFVVQRLGHDCHVTNPELKCQVSENGQMTLSDIFPKLFSDKVSHTSLSLIHEGQTVEKTQALQLEPMELYAFQLAS